MSGSRTGTWAWSCCLRPGRCCPRGATTRWPARPLRRAIQREIEDSLSEKILFGELRAGQIVTVDVEGTGPEAQFTFEGVARPAAVPDAPPAVI